MVLLFPVHFVCHPHDYDDQHYEKDEQKYHIEHAPDLTVKTESWPQGDVGTRASPCAPLMQSTWRIYRGLAWHFSYLT